MPQTLPEAAEPPATAEVPDTHETPPLDRGLLAAVEAILLSVERPIPVAKIAEPITPVLGIEVGGADVEAAITALNDEYDTQGRAFRIEPVSGGYRLMTRPEHAPVIAAMHRARATTRLSRPALETLSIIAYRQPVTRAELEAIRGVACGEVLRSLLDRKMIKIAGRAEELGRPMLYGTTPQFLDAFGLANIKDLPKPEELADRLEQSQGS
ncbi:SMC-Scp complex subunit ScpB [Limnoraphis robusta]|uniref:SMC-Scp complex subunit ScpB n=1 Tax=Limnoraphis robusta CCNP1315 TaxID=3110306 RepID=A0ABU5U539_9CYAN|nr:SMC-Scp complex subunit ScpB [Limnoraphis robusta]MEA5522311.1 SMC-Scp complex subunit ScpB [Limnoraphis robusta CCNP1315]